MAKKPKKDPHVKRMDPEQQAISEIQAARLSDMSGYPIEKIKKRKLGELHKDLRLYLDPNLLLFRRVCGQVVRRNPETGDLEGVPNATVHVEDTDCSFMIYNPPGWPHWSWLFPFKCKREKLTSVVTDECGHFCVWIPAWEIDWIVNWRKARLCFPTLYRPRLKDWLERIIIPELEYDPPRVKYPFPPKDELIGRSSAILATLLRRTDVQNQLSEVAGEKTTAKLALLSEAASFGGCTARLESELATPQIPLPPPLPEKNGKKALCLEIDAEISNELLERIGKIDFHHWVGPFWRCIDIVLGIWTPVFDVPDITFQVTQDTDGDGNEEVIYSEGYFDVRWNVGAISNVLLEAHPSALSSPNCQGPEIEEGICTEPKIVTAGLMPLQGPHFDTTTGYAKLVNRARSGGMSTSARDLVTETPMCHTVQLHGCHRFEGADHYRILKRFDGAASFTPILGETWISAQLAGPPLIISPDDNGWYPVLPAANLVFPHWLLNWRTWRYADGRYEIKLELGDAAKSHHSESDVVPIQIDNSNPVVVFTSVAWRYSGVAAWTTLPVQCPVIRRIAEADVEIQVECEVSAKHYRNAKLFGRGCNYQPLPKMDAASDYDNWHTGPADNSWLTSARFFVDGALDSGAFTFGVSAYGRPFNPAGGDSGPSSDWDYDWVYSWIQTRRQIAIVDR